MEIHRMTDIPEPADTGTESAPDTTTDTPTEPPPMPDAKWNPERNVYEPSTTEPPPRSLAWWKAQAHQHENTGKWLHAEVAAERDQLQARLATMQRAQVETVIGPRLHNAADFWHHAKLADVLNDEDGTVDSEKLHAALADIVQRAPYLAPSTAAPATVVTSEHAGINGADNTPSFADLLKAAATSNRGIASE
jgi:hypothetical protein